MRRTMIASITLAALIATAPAAPAAFVTGCCACVQEEATTSQAPKASLALFCNLIVGEGYPEFVSTCDDAGGSPVCTDEVPGQSCPQTLAAAESIICPSGPGVPTAGPVGLVGLVAALSAAGLFILRRRGSLS
jgi:hypothetical protein